MKNILIVGGSSGIGQNLVEKLSKEGHRVWSASRSVKPEDSSGNVSFLTYDAAEEADLALEVEQLDGLVYCPGSINLRPFNRLAIKDFRDEMSINLFGAVRTIQQVLPQLKKSEDASIVLFSTVAVSQGMPYHASVASAKGAVEGLGKALAAELAPKIRVNVIAPSIVDTPLAERLLSTEDKKKASAERHPLRRVGKTDDIADMAAFLLSDKSGWITGQIMPVDGGLSSLRLP